MRKWLKDKTRLLFAGLFVFGGLLVGVLVASLVLPAKTPHELLGLGAATLLCLLLFAAMAIFNPDNAFTYEQSLEMHIQELEQQGLLESISYQARRAFQVEEFEDEGSHYYIELENGSVLFLSGQYLYEYEPGDNNKKFSQPRYFPCTEFTVLRRLPDRHVIDLLRQGKVLEPELLAPSFSDEDLDNDCFPGDGTIITDRTYDAIKQERLTRR